MYGFLLNFISHASKATFEFVHGLRVLGFGLLHLDGEVFLIFLIVFYMLFLNKGKGLNNFIYFSFCQLQ
jgi:hypothetical protein